MLSLLLYVILSCAGLTLVGLMPYGLWAIGRYRLHSSWAPATRHTFTLITHS